MKNDDHRKFIHRRRGTWTLFVGSAILSGLLWRSRYLPLSPFMSKYGGDALWALVVFFGFGFFFPKMATSRVFAISLGFAWLIEFSQLYHAPWIDSIRAVRLGHLVLGSTFNPPDLAAYVVGVGLGALVEVGWKRVGN